MGDIDVFHLSPQGTTCGMSASCTSWPKGCLFRISNVKLTPQKLVLMLGGRLERHA